MASQASSVEFIAAQVASAGAVSTRKMSGEYAPHCDGKFTALIRDDQLVVKPTEAGRADIGGAIEAPPYKGAKPCFPVSGDQRDDRDWLATLIRIPAVELPFPDTSRRTKGVRQHGNR